MQIRHLPTAVILGSLFVLHTSQVCLAQRARHPSSGQYTLQSNSQRGFGRVGGALGSYDGISSGSRSAAGSLAGMTGGAGRRGGTSRDYRVPGMGDGLNGNIYYARNNMAPVDFGYGQGQSYGMPLIGGQNRRPYLDPWQVSAPPGTKSLLAAVHGKAFEQQEKAIYGLGMPSRLGSTNYLDWMPAERSSFGSPSPTYDTSPLYEPVVSATPAAKPDPNQPRQNLAQLVGNQMLALRRSYTLQGWEAFRAGDYQGAMRVFALAENTALDDPQEHAYYKLLTVYGGISAGQYAQASNALNWLLEQDSKTGRLLYPGVFNRIFDENKVKTVGELYEEPGEVARPLGYQNPAYRDHSQKLESAAAQAQNAPTLRSLLAVMEWGRGRRSQAIVIAQKLPANAERLTRLAPLLEEADRLYQNQSANPGSTAGNSLPALAGTSTTRPGS